MSLKIEINNKKLLAEEGETILEVLSKNGIKVPTLCHMKGFFPTGACRMCIVEHKQSGKLIPSCSFPVIDGMSVFTHSSRVIEARKMIVELLLSNHPDDCLFCNRNNKCELQSLGVEHHVIERNLSGVKNSFHKDLSSASVVRDPDKCLLCGRCVRVCEERIGVSAIDYVNRGSKAFIGTAFDRGLNTSSCINCGQCIIVCPTGALTEKDHIARTVAALNDPLKVVIAQHAPAISVSIAEEFNLAPGRDYSGIINAALRKIGFARVFDTSFSADLTIMEEANELIERINNSGRLPMITSCCPGWVKYAEEFAPDFLANLSTCKSPQQMLGAVIKSYYAEKEGIEPENIFSVSIMPCTAKKFESQREEFTKGGVSEVDAVLTTREFIRLIRMYGIDLHKLESELPDSPHGVRSSAGKLFGTTGGVMEAAIRTAFFKLTGQELINFKVDAVRGTNHRKEAFLMISGFKLGVAVVSGMGNAVKLIDEIRNGRKDIHFIEIMSCAGGCISGGGQPLGASERSAEWRMKTLYDIDENETLKVSHKNHEVIELYNKFLGHPLGHKSHELLHTKYTQRNVLL
jgi:iron-only hydrogenase group A